MYTQREIPLVFDAQVEVICLMTSIIASKIRTRDFDKDDVKCLLSPFIITRAYQKLFPAFEVCDGVVARFGQPSKKPEFGDLGYFHYHENHGRHPLPGQIKLIPHSWLIFKEPSDKALALLGIDILPIGSIANRFISVPLCFDQCAPSFVKTSLPRDVDEKDIAQRVRYVLPSLKTVKEEVDAIYAGEV